MERKMREEFGDESKLALEASKHKGEALQV